MFQVQHQAVEIPTDRPPLAHTMSPAAQGPGPWPWTFERPLGWGCTNHPVQAAKGNLPKARHNVCLGPPEPIAVRTRQREREKGSRNYKFSRNSCQPREGPRAVTICLVIRLPSGCQCVCGGVRRCVCAPEECTKGGTDHELWLVAS